MELICKLFYFFVHLYGNKLHQERMHSIILYLIFVIVLIVNFKGDGRGNDGSTLGKFLNI